MTQTASLVIMLTLSDVVEISQPGRNEGRVGMEFDVWLICIFSKDIL